MTVLLFHHPHQHIFLRSLLNRNGGVGVSLRRRFNCTKVVSLKNYNNSRPLIDLRQKQIRWSSTGGGGNHNHHVCVIGSGPAGFYAAQHLLKLRSPSSNRLHVDIFEKLPVPFGLVRYGVAPDHPEVKNVTNSFTEVMKNERVRFVGNVEAGVHFSLGDLLQAYHAVVLCYGATSDRLLNIPNESLITSAREFVGWYNGLPSNSDLPVNLRQSSRALIIGHGNVALDIARILLTDVRCLENTDIAPYALEELKGSGVKEVVIVGRRGVLQVSFTIKEFREMVKLGGVKWLVDVGESDKGIVTDALPRPRKRLTDLILKSALDNSQPTTINNTDDKHWTLKFLRSPLRIDKTEDGKRLSVKFQVNRLEGDRPVKTDQVEEIICDVAFRSIGYKGKRIFTDLPFDEAAGVIPNQNGRVTGMEGIYCSGWAGQGPRGVILSTMQHAFDVAKLVSSDLDSGAIGKESQKRGYASLEEKGLFSGVRVTSYKDYLKIAIWEQENGEKVTNVREMIRICSENGKA